MQNASEEQWFDAEEVASMRRTYRRCRIRLGHVDPNQRALSVIRFFRNGITDEDIVFSMLTQVGDVQALGSSCIVRHKQPSVGAGRWGA